MIAGSLLQVKKWRWGKLSQISQGKLSAPSIANFHMKIVSNFM